MLRMNIGKRFVHDMYSRIANDENFVPKCGCERMVVEYGNDLILKMPLFTTRDNLYGRTYLKKLILNNKPFYFESSRQTKREIEMLQLIPEYIIDEFIAKFYMYGSYEELTFVICEKLTPLDDRDLFDDCVVNSIKKMCDDFCQKASFLPIGVYDIHSGNLGWDKNGNIKFSDIGYWKFEEEFYFAYDQLSETLYRENTNYSNYLSSGF